jgi:hypothetical protein
MADNTQGAGTLAPAAAPQQGTTVGDITVGGQTMSSADVTKLAGEQAAAEAAEAAKPKGDAGGAGAAGAGAGAAGGEAMKPGGLYRDGKEVSSEFIPRQRYNEQLGQYRDRVRAAGIDPETFQPLPKGDGKAGAAAATSAAAGEPVKGQEPWAGDLLAVPKEGDLDADGNPKYRTVTEFTQAVAEVAAHNKWVELKGRDALKAAEAEKERAATREQEATAKLLDTFRTETLPSALAKHHLTQEQYEERLTALKAVPDNAARDATVYNFALRQSDNGAELLLALADEAGTAEGQAFLAGLGRLAPEALIGKLFRMDSLIQAGLTAQGKPRASGGGHGGNGGGLQPLAQQGTQGQSTLSPSPTVGRAGSALDPKDLTGDAFFHHLEAQQKSERDARRKR